MDKLDEIFSMQKQLDDDIKSRRKLEFSQTEWLQKKSLALIEEVSEVLNEVNYKWWKNPKPIDEDKLKEELVDVLHFFVSMCIDANMTSEEMHRIYKRKNDENHARQNGTSTKKGYEASLK